MQVRTFKINLFNKWRIFIQVFNNMGQNRREYRLECKHIDNVHKKIKSFMGLVVAGACIRLYMERERVRVCHTV